MDWLTGGRFAQAEAKRLIPQLADATTRDRAAQELIRLDTAAIPQLLDALQTRDLELLPIYQQVLARIPSASPALTKTLREAHPIMRARVVDVLSLRKDPGTVAALLEALNGEYYTVRARAAVALGRIGDQRAIEPLLAALKDDEDEVRIAACLGLGFFKDPDTFDDITTVLLDDPKIEVRQAAAKALGNTGHPAALPYLMEALHDSFWWYEREVAAGDLLSAIEKMGPVAVDPLIEALQDKEGVVRKFAATLLGRLGDLRAIEPLGMALYDMHHDVGELSAEALAAFGAPSFEVLVEALEHPEMWVRIHSVDVLPKVNEPRVALVLLEMLKDPEREVKKHVIQAIGELKDERTLPALQEIASDRSDREFACARERSDGRDGLIVKTYGGTSHILYALTVFCHSNNFAQGENHDLLYLASSYCPYCGRCLLGWRHLDNDLFCRPDGWRNCRSGPKIYGTFDDEPEVQSTHVGGGWTDSPCGSVVVLE